MEVHDAHVCFSSCSCCCLCLFAWWGVLHSAAAVLCDLLCLSALCYWLQSLCQGFVPFKNVIAWQQAHWGGGGHRKLEARSLFWPLDTTGAPWALLFCYVNTTLPAVKKAIEHRFNIACSGWQWSALSQGLLVSSSSYGLLCVKFWSMLTDNPTLSP